nr:uncharacterized protein LOC129263514 [Lytechinus pictus]
MGAKGSKKSNRATMDNADPGSGLAGNGQRDETPSGDPKPSVETGRDAAVSSTEAVTATQAVETSSAQGASGGAGTTPATESSKKEATTDILDTTGSSEKAIFPAHWIGFREIFVQYIPGKPYTLTEFGAHLYSSNGPHGRHEFIAIDGSGLAKKVGLRNRDVLLTINNLTSGLTNSSPLAILECFTDIGPNICLVVERNGNETWLFAFHLDEEGNRPIVKELFSPISSTITSGRLLFRDNSPEAAFDVAAQYAYESSAPVQIILKEDDHYMEIDTEKATFVPASQFVLKKTMGAKGSKKSNRATVDNADPGSGLAGNGQLDETTSGDAKPSVETRKDATVSSTEAVTATQAAETWRREPWEMQARLQRSYLRRTF